MLFRIVSGCIALAVLIGCQSTGVKSPRQPAFFTKHRGEMDLHEVLSYSSSESLKFRNARVLIDNDAAFDSKIEAIRSAKSGETIRLVYYIFTDDYSSSVFTSELMAAAQRGVKVKLLLDYLTNYKYLDLLSYMESASNGRIEVRLYGRPNANIVRDIEFMSYPCPVAQGTPSAHFCSDAKWKRFPSKNPDFFAKLLLSGLSAKNGMAIKTALLAGQQLDIEKLTAGSAQTDEESKESLKEFFKLLYDAKVNGDLIAMLKVNIALALYGEQLNPIMNEVFGRMPISQMEKTSGRDWEHLTDFTHHKLLLVEDRFMQLGGRNIEDSYHTKPLNVDGKKFVDKYIFIDTDFAGEIEKGGDSVAQAFDDLWDFNAMTISVNDTYKMAPNDFIANPEAAQAALQACTKKPYETLAHRQEFMSCLNSTITSHASYKDRAARGQEIAQKITDNAQVYYTKYAPHKKESQSWRPGPTFNDSFSSTDLQKMDVTYIENLHYNRSLPKSKRTRFYGVENGQEAKYGKYIHRLWVRGLENACNTATEQLQKNPKAPEVRVILNSAYLIPPSLLMRAFVRMIDGTWDCRNVRVTLLTNSLETTDLNPINFLAKYQMMAFFHTYATRKGFYGSNSEKAAKFEYYELKKQAGDDRISLHTKVSILGNDVIIGSANGDVRSYYMDTNNGVYIRNAHDFIANYNKYIDGMLKDRRQTTNLTPTYLTREVNFERFIKEDRHAIEIMLQRFNFKNPRTKEAAIKHIHSSTSGLAKVIYSQTQKIMSPMYIEVYDDFIEVQDQKKLEEQARIEAQFNRLLQIF